MERKIVRPSQGNTWWPRFMIAVLAIVEAVFFMTLQEDGKAIDLLRRDNKQIAAQLEQLRVQIKEKEDSRNKVPIPSPFTDIAPLHMEPTKTVTAPAHNDLDDLLKPPKFRLVAPSTTLHAPWLPPTASQSGLADEALKRFVPKPAKARVPREPLE